MLANHRYDLGQAYFLHLCEEDQVNAVRAAQELGLSGTVQFFVSTFDCVSRPVQMAMIAALAVIPGTEAKSVLVTLIEESEDNQLRWLAINSLNTIHLTLSDSSVLIGLLLSSAANAELREAAYFGLSELCRAVSEFSEALGQLHADPSIHALELAYGRLPKIVLDGGYA